MKLYSKSHLWIDITGNKARIGMTNLAQERLGDIVFLSLPDVGEQVKIDNKFGEVESAKTVTELLSMANGTVTSVNDDLVLEPYRINENADEEWLIEVEVAELSKDLTKEEPND